MEQVLHVFVGRTKCYPQHTPLPVIGGMQLSMLSLSTALAPPWELVVVRTACSFILGALQHSPV